MTRFSRMVTLVFVMMLTSLIQPIHADIVGLSGNVSMAGFTDFSGNVAAFEHDNLLFGVEERGVKLAAPLVVDATAAGVVPPVVAGAIPANQRVKSHFFQFDQTRFVGDAATVFNLEVTFSQPILGVIITAGNLDATDGLFNPGGYLYATGKAVRGLGDNGPYPLNDAISFAGKKLELSFTNSTYLTSYQDDFDQFRIITAIPLPAAAWMGLGLLATLFIVRKYSQLSGRCRG